jgi:hypothetical protein
MVPAGAAIDSPRLGARYDATSNNIVFRVYSSRATRIELYLYAASYGSPGPYQACTTIRARATTSVRERD